MQKSLFHFFTFSNINYSRANKLGTTPGESIPSTESSQKGSLERRGNPMCTVMQVRKQTPTGTRSLPVCRGTRPSVHHGKVVPGSNKDSLTRPVNTAASGALPSTPQHCETPYSPSMPPYMVDESGPVQQDVFPCPLHKVGSKDPALLSQHERMTRAGGLKMTPPPRRLSCLSPQCGTILPYTGYTWRVPTLNRRLSEDSGIKPARVLAMWSLMWSRNVYTLV